MSWWSFHWVLSMGPSSDRSSRVIRCVALIWPRSTSSSVALSVLRLHLLGRHFSQHAVVVQQLVQVVMSVGHCKHRVSMSASHPTNFPTHNRNVRTHHASPNAPVSATRSCACQSAASPPSCPRTGASRSTPCSWSSSCTCCKRR